MPSRKTIGCEKRRSFACLRAIGPRRRQDQPSVSATASTIAIPPIQPPTTAKKCARDMVSRQVRQDGGIRRIAGRSRVARRSTDDTLAPRVSKSFGRTLSKTLLRRYYH